MEELDRNIYKCFEKLNDRLFEITKGNLVEAYFNKQHVIDSLRENGIHSIDPEEVQDEIEALTERVKSILNDLPVLINNYEYPEDKPEDFNGFQEFLNREIINLDEKKANLMQELQVELKYYLVELERHYEFAKARVSSSSASMSNAGIKIRFDLTVEEIGTLFKALLDSRVLRLEDGITDESITKAQLGNWITKNISPKKKEYLSLSTIKASFNYKNSAAVVKILDKVSAKLKTAK